MKNLKIIFVGPTGGGLVPTNGASVKNYYIKNALQNHFNVKVIDTEFWKKKPYILIRLLFKIIFDRNATFIVSANNTSSYRLLKCLKIFRIKNVIYWVIGGSIANWISSGKVNKNAYSNIKYFIVEGLGMKKTLNECGFSNVIHLPNFKSITYLPTINKQKNDAFKFVFLSRITEDKGCTLIIEAVDILINTYGVSPLAFSVDFYGKIADDYYDSFQNLIKQHTNINYKGFLDLRVVSNYDVLANYDIMLFPTYWHGEGFPGIIIDAFVSGIPVIASNWNMNEELISDEKSGFLIPAHSSIELAKMMKKVMDMDKTNLYEMSDYCQSCAKKFDVHHLLNEDLFNKLELF